MGILVSICVCLAIIVNIKHSVFQKIIEKSSGVVDESLKYVEAGVNLVSEDVQELSQAIVEDTQARFTNLAFLLADLSSLILAF